MQINETNSKNSTFFQANKRKDEKNKEFEKYLENLNKEEKKKSDFSDDELNLSKILKDFKNYAINKSIKDKQKENEATLLNKLFTLIDSNIENNKKFKDI